MGGETVHDAAERRLVDAHQPLQGLNQERFHNVAAAKGIGNGDEVIDIPEVPAEKVVHSLQEALFHHLSAGEESAVKMLRHFFLRRQGKFHPLHAAAEKDAARKDGAHGIHGAAGEDEGEVPPLLLLDNGGKWP